jgi:hypothetical protein
VLVIRLPRKTELQITVTEMTSVSENVRMKEGCRFLAVMAYCVERQAASRLDRARRRADRASQDKTGGHT